MTLNQVYATVLYLHDWRANAASCVELLELLHGHSIYTVLM